MAVSAKQMFKSNLGERDSPSSAQGGPEATPMGSESSAVLLGASGQWPLGPRRGAQGCSVEAGNAPWYPWLLDVNFLSLGHPGMLRADS